MADSSYPFPPDRFDQEADAVAFHGAHRAEEPFWRQNLVYLVIIAAAVIALLVLLFLIGGMGGKNDERATGPTTGETETAQPSDAGGSDQGGGKKPEGEAPPVDKGTTVTVINAGGIGGLAGSWRDTLRGADWTDVKIATADSRQEKAVVFYRDEADRGTAQALADEVGAEEARQSDEYDGPITFVAVTEPQQKSGDGGDGENG